MNSRKSPRFFSYRIMPVVEFRDYTDSSLYYEAFSQLEDAQAAAKHESAIQVLWGLYGRREDWIEVHLADCETPDGAAGILSSILNQPVYYSETESTEIFPEAR